MVKKMTKCAYCEYNDGMVYTSIPPKYKCTITNEFHLGDDDCNVEFAPVKHGHWIDMQYPLAGHTFISCSECGERLDIDSSYKSIINYCPNCGARMDLTE